MGDLVIGIDLGTTNSCASYYVNGKVKIIENKEGNRITPSFVFFLKSDENVIVGQYAKKMSEALPENGIYGIKRLVGRQFDDPHLQHNIQYFPFKVIDDFNNPVVVIEGQNKTITKTPKELCAVILRKIKKDVELLLDQTVCKAVITVPAYFNITQREVTLAAANDAGFTVLKLLNEPTAAAISYYLRKDCKKPSYSLVYDLGGGTFDVAILLRSSSNIKIICVDGDTNLGGKDFDNLIIDYVCKELMKNYNYNPKSERRTMRRLHNKCEAAKKSLSALPKTTIRLDGFVKDQPTIEIALSRAQFEDMADSLFKRTLKIVDNCLNTNNISKRVLEEIILSGGSTRIPKIQTMLSEYFDGKKLNKFLNPDECVAEGAAVQAAILSHHDAQKIDKIHIIDVTPLSLGISCSFDKMCVLIERNTPIPACQSQTFVTIEDQQTSINFKIYEGERLNVKKNRYLANLEISNLTPAPPGQCKVTVTMMIDSDGLLTMKAEEKFGKNVRNLKVVYTRGTRSDKEVRNALKDAEDNQEEDERFVKLATLKEYLVDYCISAIHNFENKTLTNLYKESFELCSTTKKIVKNTDINDENELKGMIHKVRASCQSIIKTHKFMFMPVDLNI